MPQTHWEELSDAERVALLLGDDVLAFPQRDPLCAIDYANISGTLNISQYFDLVNNSGNTLYFRAEAQVINGNENAWSGTIQVLGTINPSGKAMTLWTPERTVPASKTVETLRVNIRAYLDASFSNLYGEDYVDFSYHFFKHQDGTIVDFSDFETGFDGWSDTSSWHRVTNNAYSGAHSIYLWKGAPTNETTDSSGQKIINKTYYLKKTFNLGSYSTAYLVIHATNWKENTSGYTPIIRIWTSGGYDFIIRLEESSFPKRIAVPLETENSLEVKIATSFGGGSGSETYLQLDTFIVVGFS